MVQHSQLHHNDREVVWEEDHTLQQTHNGHDSSSTSSLQNGLAGLIMWLPPKPLNANFDFEDGCHNHPVLMLSSQPKDGMVDFFIMTSLKQTPLDQKHAGPRNVATRAHYLPIDPAERHPDNGILLYIASGGGQMQKKTYVYTEKVRTAPLSALRSYKIGKSKHAMRLSDRSLAMVKLHARYLPPAREVTEHVAPMDDDSSDDDDDGDEEEAEHPPPYTLKDASRASTARPASVWLDPFALLHSSRQDVALNSKYPAKSRTTTRLAIQHQYPSQQSPLYGYHPPGNPGLTRYGLPPAPQAHGFGQEERVCRQSNHHWNHRNVTTPLLPRHHRADAPEQAQESLFLQLIFSVGSFLSYIASSVRERWRRTSSATRYQYIVLSESSRTGSMDIFMTLFLLLLLGVLIFGAIYIVFLLIVAIGSAIASVWQWAAQEITDIGSAIGSTLTAILEWFGGAWATLVNALVGIWQWMIQGIENIGATISEFFQGIGGWFVGAWDVICRALAEALHAVIAAVKAVRANLDFLSKT